MTRTSTAICLASIALNLCVWAGCGDDADTPGPNPGGRGAVAGAGAAGRGASGAGTAGSGASSGAPGRCGAPPAPADKPGNECPDADPVPLQAARVGTDFTVALYVTSLPGDPRLVVVERGGTVQLLDPQTGDKTLFFDLEERSRGHELLAATASEGEQGLLGLAFHPNFPEDPRFFLNFTARADEDVTVVSGFELSPGRIDRGDPESEQMLLEFYQPQGNHNGGMLEFGPDGCLFVGSGDGGQGNDVGEGHAPGGNGQSLATPLGKILRLDVDRPEARPEGNLTTASTPHIWDYGLRNPWRFSFDRQTGDLYIGDVGQGAREEVDVEARGRGNLNYGWPIMEGERCLSSGTCAREGLVLPVDVYENADGNDCMVGGYVYRGEKIPSLRGWYVYGDNGSAQKVAAFVWDGEGRCNDRTINLRDRDQLALDSDITSFGEDSAGELYIVTRRSVYRIEPR